MDYDEIANVLNLRQNHNTNPQTMSKTSQANQNEGEREMSWYWGRPFERQKLGSDWLRASHEIFWSVLVPSRSSLIVRGSHGVVGLFTVLPCLFSIRIKFYFELSHMHTEREAAMLHSFRNS